MVGSGLKWHNSLILRHGAKAMIGVLIFPDFQLLDAAGPISVFEIASRLAKRQVPIRLMAAEPGPVRSTSGAEMLATRPTLVILSERTYSNTITGRTSISPVAAPGMCEAMTIASSRFAASIR